MDNNTFFSGNAFDFSGSADWFPPDAWLNGPSEGDLPPRKEPWDLSLNTNSTYAASENPANDQNTQR